jgi:hypothetical protein
LAVKVEFKKPTTRDAFTLANTMQVADIAECALLYQQSPLQAVQASIQYSHPDHLTAAFANDKLVCVFGCVPVDDQFARCWMLATHEKYHYSRRLTRETKRIVRMMLDTWPIIGNTVDARNVDTIRWLKLLGFQFAEPYEFRPGYYAIQFEMRR